MSEERKFCEDCGTEIRFDHTLRDCGQQKEIARLHRQIAALAAAVQSRHDYGPASPGEQEAAWQAYCARSGWNPNGHPAAKNAYVEGFCDGDSFSEGDEARETLRTENARQAKHIAELTESYLQKMTQIAALEAQLADERARIEMICEERDKSSAEAEEEHGRVVEELRAEVRGSYEDVEAKDAELREVRQQWDNLRQWEQIAKHVSRQQAQRILALEAALTRIRDICQEERLPCGQIYEIAAESLLSPSSPQTASREESNG